MSRLINGKPDDRVRKDVLGQPSLPSDMLIPESVLGTDDKEGSNRLDVVQPFEVVVCPVKHIEGTRSIWNGIHPIHIVELGLRNVEDGWDLSFEVKQGVNLDSAFSPPEMSPFVNAETKVNCR